MKYLSARTYMFAQNLDPRTSLPELEAKWTPHVVTPTRKERPADTSGTVIAFHVVVKCAVMQPLGIVVALMGTDARGSTIGANSHCAAEYSEKCKARQARIH